MFVSYSSKSGYGYMCFHEGNRINDIHNFLEDRIFEKIHIIFMSKFSDSEFHDIYMHTNGIYRLDRMEHTLRDTEEICCLYDCLYQKYGFTNILGYYPVRGML